eukprot:scaffold60022_cov35-Tisochrysis_lutea.AAC.2
MLEERAIFCHGGTQHLPEFCFNRCSKRGLQRHQLRLVHGTQQRPQCGLIAGRANSVAVSSGKHMTPLAASVSAG